MSLKSIVIGIFIGVVVSIVAHRLERRFFGDT